jgi:predicted dehydrogenase
MIAYRLDFEPENLKAIQIVNDGDLGKPRFFSSVFGQQVPEGNIRLQKSIDGGPLMDVGIYCINAARYLFPSEPEEIVPSPPPRMIHASTKSIKSRRPFFGSLANGWHRLPKAWDLRRSRTTRIVGTKSDLRASPGYGYHDERELFCTVVGKERKESFKRGDQFGAELVYFSQCILDDTTPEPGGLEGIADIRVIDAILKSIRSGRAVRLPQTDANRYPSEDQKIELPPVKPPQPVNAESPSAK